MTAGPVSVRSYLVVTLGYWALTLTDGALRMLVLLHFHALGYSPFQLALLFVLYEVLGAVTNLLGGVVAARLGLKVTLVAGLALQVGALLMLSGLGSGWSVAAQVTYVFAAQGVSGVAKDLTKLSAKSAIKLVVVDDERGALFKWVAVLTGSKNALKGIGFFAGGALLAAVGFESSLLGMAAFVGGAAALTLVALPTHLGRAKSSVGLGGVFSKSRGVNILSGSRVFLFGARDVWFVVALPVFLYDSLGWGMAEVSATMAAWVVGYGGVQALAPKLAKAPVGGDHARAAQRWGVALALSAFSIVVALHTSLPTSVAVLGGLAIFGALFAVNSSLHSYLILAHTDADQVAANVGFYYMANAIGRLVGTLLSGAIYQLAGLNGCLLTAGVMLLFAAGLTRWLPILDAPRADTPASGAA